MGSDDRYVSMAARIKLFEKGLGNGSNKRVPVVRIRYIIIRIDENNTILNRHLINPLRHLLHLLKVLLLLSIEVLHLLPNQHL